MLEAGKLGEASHAMETRQGVQIRIVTCKRCGYRWPTKLKKPVKCASCRSPYWNKRVGCDEEEHEGGQAEYMARFLEREISDEIEAALVESDKRMTTLEADRARWAGNREREGNTTATQIGPSLQPEEKTGL